MSYEVENNAITESVYTVTKTARKLEKDPTKAKEAVNDTDKLVHEAEPDANVRSDYLVENNAITENASPVAKTAGKLQNAKEKAEAGRLAKQRDEAAALAKQKAGFARLAQKNQPNARNAAENYEAAHKKVEAAHMQLEFANGILDQMDQLQVHQVYSACLFVMLYS